MTDKNLCDSCTNFKCEFQSGIVRTECAFYMPPHIAQDYRSKQLIDELSKMSPMVIATAYAHAINYTLYGVDVTEKWLTATQQSAALEKSYKKGYYDALQRQAESDERCVAIIQQKANKLKENENENLRN